MNKLSAVLAAIALGCGGQSDVRSADQLGDPCPVAGEVLNDVHMYCGACTKDYQPNTYKDCTWQQCLPRNGC